MMENTGIRLEDAAAHTIYRKIVESLVVAVDARDEYTSDHSVKVSMLAYWFGESMQLSRSQLEAIRVGALLHDIGKIGIPDFILRKPGRLTDLEIEIIRDHPRIGWKILEPLDLPWHIRSIVESHHERWDGTGYPHGKKGFEIPIEAQIVSICDYWDALRSNLSYKQGYPEEVCLAELQKQKNHHFEPGLVNNFRVFIEWAAETKGEAWYSMYQLPRDFPPPEAL